MNLNKTIFLIFLLLLFLNISCTNTDIKNTSGISDTLNRIFPDSQYTHLNLMQPDLSKGEELYNTHCLVCHQKSGLGIPGSYPPLAASDYLLENKIRAFYEVQRGTDSAIRINNIEYPGDVMPSQELTDTETIDVLNYIYNAWGNNGGTILMHDINATKQK